MNLRLSCSDRPRQEKSKRARWKRLHMRAQVFDASASHFDRTGSAIELKPTHPQGPFVADSVRFPAGSVEADRRRPVGRLRWAIDSIGASVDKILASEATARHESGVAARTRIGIDREHDLSSWKTGDGPRSPATAGPSTSAWTCHASCGSGWTKVGPSHLPAGHGRHVHCQPTAEWSVE